MSTETELNELQKAFALIEGHMYCSGVVPLDLSNSTLFFRDKDKTPSVCRIGFSERGRYEPRQAAEACQPASFGLNDKDVLDENYRKAGKMECADFAIQLSVHASGILNTVASSLTQDGNSGDIRAELYKLNVYGPGSFFKPHVDTPRSDKMFASLVIVLPTKHEGGSLRFTDNGQQWSFDSADLVSDGQCIAFSAFYSDIEHEVLPVASGYRVTLTYNLFWTNGEASATPKLKDHPFKEAAKAALAASLADQNYLPKGGFIGFGLTHKYPINNDQAQFLWNVRLKGADAAIMDICKELSLETSVRAVYKPDDDMPLGRSNGHVLMDWFADLEGVQVNLDNFYSTGYLGHLCKYDGGVYVTDKKAPRARNRHFDDIDMKAHKRIDWVKPLSNVNDFKSHFMAYGNQAESAVAYGDVCLVARIRSASKRLGLNLEEGQAKDE